MQYTVIKSLHFPIVFTKLHISLGIQYLESIRIQYLESFKFGIYIKFIEGSNLSLTLTENYAYAKHKNVKKNYPFFPFNFFLHFRKS